MCGNFPNIKVVEGNAFSLVLPLKRRTFESCQPIDEDIDATQLTDVVVKFGGVEYTPSLGVDGVTIILPATLARGTYDIVLTAKYQSTDIRAAYESAISIVPWNSQSDAQQFVPGSPIVCDAAYVIGGALTDEELEQLKEEYREKNAQLDQAIADAEEAKEEWEQKAADLDGVAKEATLGTPLVGQPSTLFAAIAAGGGGGAEFYHNPATEMSSATATLDPNIMYVWDEVSALTITLNAPTDTSIVNEYMLCFYSGSTPTTLTFTNNNVQVVGNIAAESIINVSIVYNSLTDSYSVLIA